MVSLTPLTLASLYGATWRFGCYGSTWVAVRDDDARFEADDALSLVCAIAQGRSVS